MRRRRMVAGGLLCCKTCTVITLHHTHILCSLADVSGTVFFLLFLESTYLDLLGGRDDTS